MTLKPWKVLSSKPDHSHNFFHFRTDQAHSPRTDKAYDFYILESNPWVNIIPLTPENDVVLVRQYRHGIREVILEIPGGVVEQEDTPIEAAKRELLEETGYKALEIIPLGSIYPNPAIQNNRCYTFLAKDVFRAGDQQLDEKEDIEVLCRPVTEIPRLIREGEIEHSLVISAFYRYFMEYEKC